MDKFLNKIVWLFILAPAIYLAIIWNRLPKRIAIHFNLQGNADKYGNSKDLIFIVALIATLGCIIYLLLPLVYKLDPKKTAAANKVNLQRLAFAITIFMSFISCIIVNSALKENFHLNIRIVFAAMGILWCVMGNYMHNIKPNYFAGFRMPWTLNNEENWRKTHLLAGKIWFAGGLLIIVPCLVTPPVVSIIIFFTITVLIIIIPGVYSYRLYKKQSSLNSTIK